MIISALWSLYNEACYSCSYLSLQDSHYCMWHGVIRVIHASVNTHSINLQRAGNFGGWSLEETLSDSFPCVSNEMMSFSVSLSQQHYSEHWVFLPQLFPLDVVSVTICSQPAPHQDFNHNFSIRFVEDNTEHSNRNHQCKTLHANNVENK